MEKMEKKEINITVYVRDEQIKQDLMNKYPKIKAEYIVKGASVTPLVCRSVDGKETCERGEEFIEKFSRMK